MSDFCLRGRYPIDTPEQFKLATDYFVANKHDFSGQERVSYCRSVVAKALEFGLTVPDVMKKYASDISAGPERIREAIAVRQALIGWNPEANKELDSLYKRADTADISVVAEVLRAFDEHHGLNVDWEGKLTNPYEQIMAAEPEKDEWHEWIEGIRIERKDLDDLVRNHMPTVRKWLADPITDALVADPVKAFENMTASMRRVVARLATDESGRQ